MVRVLPEPPAIDKTFDYLVPEHLGDQVRVGTRVRVVLHGRRVGGWVLEDHVSVTEGVAARPISKVTGWGPPPEVIDACRWAAHRWSGRLATFMGAASPDRVVTGLPPGGDREWSSPDPHAHEGGRGAGHPVNPARMGVTMVAEERFDEALSLPRAVLRCPPAQDLTPLVAAAARLGDTLVVVPSITQAGRLVANLRRAGVPVAAFPREWARAAAGGCVVVGTRRAAFAPVGRLAAVVVLDEHDESMQEEGSPTWHARDVAAWRAHRARVPCVLVSPCPSLESLRAAPLLAPTRSAERAGWPLVTAVDQRAGDTLRSGRFPAEVVEVLRSGLRVLCVCNVKGRARLLACASCGTVAECSECGGAMVQDDEAILRCARSGHVRPVVCLHCSGTRFKNLRPGVSRLREELSALAGTEVAEITGGSKDPDHHTTARIIVGTEAVLHQVDRADVVVFVDFDSELMAPRYRAEEQAMALIARAARLVGGRPSGGGGGVAPGRVLVLTRQPDHPVLVAARAADPGRLVERSRSHRSAAGMPPFGTIVEVGGSGAPDFMASLEPRLTVASGGVGAEPIPGVQITEGRTGEWLVRSQDRNVLLDALAATPRPPGKRLRLRVDPLRL